MDDHAWVSEQGVQTATVTRDEQRRQLGTCHGDCNITARQAPETSERVLEEDVQGYKECESYQRYHNDPGQEFLIAVPFTQGNGAGKG